MSDSLFAVAPSDEVVVDHVSPKGPTVVAYRGTLLATAIERLKEGGYYERYVVQLPPETRDAILFALPMSWVPVELVLAHCRACDRLQLPSQTLQQLGAQTATSVMRNFFQKLFNVSGVTPWVALNSIGRMWDRIHEGGAVAVIRTGPKDVYVEQRGNPLAGSPYFTGTAQGFHKSLAELFANKAYVRRVRPRVQHPHTFAFVISWV